MEARRAAKVVEMPKLKGYVPQHGEKILYLAPPRAPSANVQKAELLMLKTVVEAWNTKADDLLDKVHGLMSILENILKDQLIDLLPNAQAANKMLDDELKKVFQVFMKMVNKVQGKDENISSLSDKVGEVMDDVAAPDYRAGFKILRASEGVEGKPSYEDALELLGLKDQDEVRQTFDVKNL